MAESHKYQVNLKEGEKAVFTLRSDKPTSLKIQSDSGVKEQKNVKFHEGVLSGAGEYVIEVSSQIISLYTLDINR